MLVQDSTLDLEVAFALIETEGLYDTCRTRIQREAQALDESLAISSELDMRPLMERVLSRREILRA